MNLIAIPTLQHTKLHNKYPQISGICPGLQMSELGYIDINWPMTLEQAQNCLREISNFSLENHNRDDVRLRAEHFKSLISGSRPNSEKIAQDYFARTGQEIPLDNVDDMSSHYHELLCKAQWFLLMAWHQQEQISEIHRIADKYAKEAKKLSLSLREDSSAEEVNNNFLSDLLIKTEFMLPPWQLILENIAPFLPPDIVLCTDDSRIYTAIHETDFELLPLNKFKGQHADELINIFGSDEKIKAFQTPLWKLLYVTYDYNTKPWLDIERTIIIIENI